MTASALAFGYFAVVVMVGLFEGMIADMINNGTGLVMGQIQVHSPDYLSDRSIYATMGEAEGDVAALISEIEEDPAIIAAAPRVFGGGLASSGTSTFPAILLGIDPEREPLVSRIANVSSGRLPRAGAYEVVAGAELMRRLNVSLGSELVLVAPAADGSLGNDLFTIVGQFNSGIPEIDGSYVLMAIDDLQVMLALAPGRIHEVVAHIDDPWDAPPTAARLEESLREVSISVSVEPWTSLRPELVDYAKLAAGSQWILIVIVFSMAVFGVANTMIMATFERRHEFALLLALGAAPSGIVRSVVAEAVSLGLVSLAGAVAVTVPTLIWLHYSPLDLTSIFGGFSMVGTFVNPVFRAEYPWGTMLGSAVALFMTALVSALYPAIRAANVSPATTLADR
ncbi:MAG: ABC transporter permease [Gemmatimonadales bacterium]